LIPHAVPSDVLPDLIPDVLPILIARIRAGHARILTKHRETALDIMDEGDDLIEAKRIVKERRRLDPSFPKWMPWVKANCGFHHSHATMYMRIARKRPQWVAKYGADLSQMPGSVLRKAFRERPKVLKPAVEPEDETPAVAETEDVRPRHLQRRERDVEPKDKPAATVPPKPEPTAPVAKNAVPERHRIARPPKPEPATAGKITRTKLPPPLTQEQRAAEFAVLVDARDLHLDAAAKLTNEEFEEKIRHLEDYLVRARADILRQNEREDQ